jgi:glycosyltransferase involved in cell wall biosynthesis
MRVLWITTVWPEFRSSAAGVRIWNVARILRAMGHEVVFGSSSREGEWKKKLEKEGYRTLHCAPNSPEFDVALKALEPQCVIFDRFMIEEMFGWRVSEILPDAFQILDTIDLHALRRIRERALQEGASLDDLESFDPGLWKYGEDDLLRELASIYRVDWTWVVSDFERDLLDLRFGIGADRVSVVRIPIEARVSESGVRKNFAWIGNFRHPPNWDAVVFLKKEVWPAVRTLVPDACVEVFGAYPPRAAMEMHAPNEGFLVRGPAGDQYAELSRFRASLAPLRYGAGIKGKILDSWAVGTPVVATSIAAEGMTEGAPFGGWIASTPQEIARACARAVSDDVEWERQVSAGRARIAELYTMEAVRAQLEGQWARVEKGRPENWIGRILRREDLQSRKYFSKWIELKESRRLEGG